ncbi:ATP-dependent Clp protease adapter ClpS [Gammaproteobacteria bacterium 45_16_T64]|nr:ATP-dependent Clp protease adapter ClpS [Gammaproteobacteria bacterium 45_16_T64]
MSKISNLQLTLTNMSGQTPYGDEEGDLAVAESKADVAPPPMYRIMMLDDDYTPMEFVVQVLETFFSMSREAATQIMLTVHTQGKAGCGEFTKDVAETKASQVAQCARENQHPLMCEIEKVS